MMYINNVIDDRDIPDDTGETIEYKIPSSSQRIDFIFTKSNSDSHEIAIII